MGRNRILHLALALAMLAVMLSSAALGQERKDPPEKPKTGFNSRKALEADPKDDELRKLQIDRYNRTLLEVGGLTELVLRGAKPPERLFDAGKRLVQSGLDVYDKPEDRIALLTDYVAFAKDFEKVMQTGVQSGGVILADAHQATYFRIDAEIQLLKAKRAAEKPKDK